MVPENVHTRPTEGIGNSWRWEGAQRPKTVRKLQNLIGICRGVGCLRINSFRGGGMDNLWKYTLLILLSHTPVSMKAFI